MNIVNIIWPPPLVLIVFLLPATAFSKISKDMTDDNASSMTENTTQIVIAKAFNICRDDQASCCSAVSTSFKKGHWQSILAAAAKCKNSDQFNICKQKSRQEYIQYLLKWIEKLKLYLHTKSLEPLQKLEIQKEIYSLEGRKKSIANIREKDCLKSSCDECESVECRSICKKNREKMIKWRNLYKKTMQGNQYLKCEDCLKALESYYNEQKNLYLQNKLKAKHPYTKKHIEIMWGMLFCLAQSTNQYNMDSRNCLDNAQRILPHAMLPFVLPPADMIQILVEKFQKEGGITKDEAETILSRRQQSIFLIKILVELFKKNEKVPDIAPAELSSVLLGLIEHNSKTLKKMTLQARLAIFNEMFKAIDEKNIELYYDNFLQNKEAFASFFLMAIRKADKKTLKMLESVGFTNDDLRSMILSLYAKDNDPKKTNFIDLLRKIFDEDTVKINEQIAEQFLRMGDHDQKLILEDDRYKKHVIRFVQNLRAVRPEWECNSSKQCRIKYLHLKSFLTPGYPVSYCEANTNGWIDAWNYSNYMLLGISLASQMLFINSDYETDAFYQAGVVGTYVFVLNGIAGVIHAQNYNPAQRRKPKTANVNIIYAGEGIGLGFRFDF